MLEQLLTFTGNMTHSSKQLHVHDYVFDSTGNPIAFKHQ